jgi:hypothetical protein
MLLLSDLLRARPGVVAQLHGSRAAGKPGRAGMVVRNMLKRRQQRVSPGAVAGYRARMPVRVNVGGWEHECCGDAVQRGDRVRWTCIVTADGSLHETHHDLGGLKTVPIQGTVVDIELVSADGGRKGIERLPSGRALRGFDDDDSGVVRERASGEVIDPLGNGFLITLIPSH